LNLSKPQSGKIEVLGLSPGVEKLQKQIAFLSEQPTRYDFLNLTQYLKFFSTMNQASAEVKNLQAQDLIANIDPTTPMKNYSKGMMQRLNFARLLLNDPELIFLDEPSTGLDPIGHLKIEEMVLGLKKQGKSIFLNTHNLDFALNVADEIVIMNMGKIVMKVDRSNTDRKALQQTFLNLESERS
jgi:ABC-2 type transport system ATP-binding protein